MKNQVQEYIKKQPSPQKEIIIKLREVILSGCPGIVEEIKMGVPWYEGKFYLVSLKDHVNMGFAVVGMADKYRNTLEGKGKFMRHLKFFSIDDVDIKKIKRLIRVTRESHVDPHPRKTDQGN